MPISYRIDAASQTIFWEFEGAVTDEELQRAVRAVWAEPQYRSEYSRLVDTTRATSAHLSADVVRWIANQNSRAGIGKMALVANADAMFGMARMYELYSEGIACQVFREESQALGWLRGKKGAGEAAAVFRDESRAGESS
jgi:hypothetical protein